MGLEAPMNDRLFLVRCSPASAEGTKLWRTPVGDQFEISDRKGRRIVHGREHHPFANGIKLQIQAADVAAVEPPRLRGALMAVNVDPAGWALPLHFPDYRRLDVIAGSAERPRRLFRASCECSKLRGRPMPLTRVIATYGTVRTRARAPGKSLGLLVLQPLP
jgi:hypothetical protein